MKYQSYCLIILLDFIAIKFMKDCFDLNMVVMSNFIDVFSIKDTLNILSLHVILHDHEAIQGRVVFSYHCFYHFFFEEKDFYSNFSVNLQKMTHLKLK